MCNAQNIIRMMQSRRIRWVRHVERVEEMKSANIILVGKREGKKALGSIGLDGMIILRWVVVRCVLRL